MLWWLLPYFALIRLAFGNFIYPSRPVEGVPQPSGQTLTQMIPVATASIVTIQITSNIGNTVTMGSLTEPIGQPTILPPIIPVGTIAPSTAIFSVPTLGVSVTNVHDSMGGGMVANITQCVVASVVEGDGKNIPTSGNEDQGGETPDAFLAFSRRHGGYGSRSHYSGYGRYGGYRGYGGYHTSFSSSRPYFYSSRYRPHFFAKEPNQPVKKIQAKKADNADSFHSFDSRRFCRSRYPFFIEKQHDKNKQIQVRKAESFHHRRHFTSRRHSFRRRRFYVRRYPLYIQGQKNQDKKIIARNANNTESFRHSHRHHHYRRPWWWWRRRRYSYSY